MTDPRLLVPLASLPPGGGDVSPGTLFAGAVSADHTHSGTLTLTWPWGKTVSLSLPAFAPLDERLRVAAHALAEEMPDVWRSLVTYTEQATPGYAMHVGVYWRRMALDAPGEAATWARRVSWWSAVDLAPVRKVAGVAQNGAGNTRPGALDLNARGLSDDTGWAWTVDGVRLRSDWGCMHRRLDGTLEVSSFDGFGSGGMETTSWADAVAWLVAVRRDAVWP